MRVWSLLITQTSKMEVFQPRIPIVSDNYQKVLDAFNEFVESEKADLKDEIDSLDWTVEADEEGWFEAYESGRYSENHVLALIIESELGELDWSC